MARQMIEMSWGSRELKYVFGRIDARKEDHAGKLRRKEAGLWRSPRREFIMKRVMQVTTLRTEIRDHPSAIGMQVLTIPGVGRQ